MVAIPFPVSSAPGVKDQEASGRLINCRSEKTEPGAPFPVIWRKCGGLFKVGETTGSPHVHLRGAFKFNSNYGDGFLATEGLFAVFDDRVWKFTGDPLVRTNLGALAGTDRVIIASNNAATPDFVCVSNNGVFNLFLAGAPTAFADADLTAGVTSVCCVNGYFIFTHSSGKITASDLNSVSVATNSFTTYQGRQQKLSRGVCYNSELIVFGGAAGAVYRDVGTLPFPLQYVTDINRGLKGKHAIAGWEDGWSNLLIWVGDDNIVYKLVGYTPVPLPNPDLTRLIEQSALTSESTSGGTILTSPLEADVYMDGPNAIWKLTNPGVWTWEYNATTGNWNERVTLSRSDQKGSCTVRVRDKWYMGDRTTGVIYEVDDTIYDEYDVGMTVTLRSGPAAVFPAREVVQRMDFDFANAANGFVGNPTIYTRWSSDGGLSFGNYVTRSLGTSSEGNKRVTILRGPKTGPKGVVVELTLYDAVHFGFMGGQMAIEQRAE